MESPEVPPELVAQVEEAVAGIVLLDDHSAAHACWALYYLAISTGGMWSPRMAQLFGSLNMDEPFETRADTVREVIKDVTEEALRWLKEHQVPFITWLMVSPCGHIEEYSVSLANRSLHVVEDPDYLDDENE